MGDICQNQIMTFERTKLIFLTDKNLNWVFEYNLNIIKNFQIKRHTQLAQFKL